MPILDVQIIGACDSANGELARELADAAGNVFESPLHGTWVKLHFIPETHYAENGGTVNGLPVLVSVTLASPPQNEKLAAVSAALSREFASIIGRSQENVHIVIEPAAKGRIAFGGELKQ